MTVRTLYEPDVPHRCLLPRPSTRLGEGPTHRTIVECAVCGRRYWWDTYRDSYLPTGWRPLRWWQWRLHRNLP